MGVTVKKGLVVYRMNPKNYYTKDEIDNKFVSVYKIKGSVATYNDLPEPSADKEGWVYDVRENGRNYVCADYGSGTYAWDDLGPVVDLSNYYTKSEIDETMATKQDTLVSGTNIKTINNQSILGEGNIEIQAGIDNYDGSTINLNSSDELQSIGFIDANSNNPTRVWSGTPQQWRDYSPITFYNYMSGSVPSYTAGDTFQWTDSYESLQALGYGCGKFIAINRDGEVFNSTNGYTWTKSSVNFPNSNFIGGKSSTVGDRIFVNNYYSTDGLNWNEVLGIGWDYNRISNAVYDGEKYYIISEGEVMASSNGIYFNEALSFLDDLDWGSFLVYGDGKFIALGSDKCYFSTDAITWSEINLEISPSTHEGNCPLVYGNGKFVAVAGSKFAYSTDGLNWTYGNLPINAQQIAFGDGAFCADGLYSSDGISWIQISDNINGRLVYGDGKFVKVDRWSNSVSTAYLEVGSTTSYYTEEYPATTASIIYSAPEVIASLTVTSVDGDNIVLSDGNTYSYLSAGNINTYRTVAQIHPNWICNVYNTDVRIGNTVIATAGGSDVEEITDEEIEEIWEETE